MAHPSPRFALLLALASALLAPPASADTLVLGQVTELSGQEVAAENTAGAKLWLDHVNALPGARHQLVMKQYDDKRDPKLTVQLTRKLLDEDHALALFGYRSTPTLEALARELDAMHIALVAPFNGSDAVRKMSRNIFYLRGSYTDETRRLVEQVTAIGIQRVAIVYQQDAFGKEALDDYAVALKKHGLEPTARLTYDRKTLDVKPVVAQLLKDEPAAALMACTPKACADIINGVREHNQSMQLGVLSNAVTGEFTRAIAVRGRGVLMSQVIPYPWNTAEAMVREFNALNAKAGNAAPVSYASLEGFAAARLMTEAIRRAGANPTRESVIRALQTMKNFDLGGIVYAPDGQHYFTEVTTLRSDGKIIR